MNKIGHPNQLFMDPRARYEEQEPWERMLKRKYRLFHADVELHAPKDRTLFNYNITDGWPKLCEFLGLAQNSSGFPHENKGANVLDFHQNLWSGTKYEEQALVLTVFISLRKRFQFEKTWNKVKKEVIEYLRRNGYEVTKD